MQPQGLGLPVERSDAKLRRAQYLARDDGTAVEIATWLIERKLAGHRATVEQWPSLPGAAQAIVRLTADLATLERQPVWLDSIATLRTFEGQAAASFVAAWRGFPLHWRRTGARRLPDHWLTIRERSSPLSASARRAVDPANAILNYAYAMPEGQCRQALALHGFDAAAGFLHADKVGRDSLVYDLMEPHQPAVDALVLAVLDRTTFRWGDFLQDLRGQYRLHPQLGRAVVAACRLPQAEIDATARELWKRLLSG